MSGLRCMLAGWIMVSVTGLAASCRQLADIEEHEVCEGVSRAAGTCTACVRSSCCAAATRCAREPGCAALDACLGECPDVDDACRTNCRDAHPGGFTEAFAALSSCSATNCAGACGEASCRYVFPDGDCAACAAKTCCAEARACGESADCLALSFRSRPCAAHDHACRGEWQRRYPAGAALARELSECLAEACGPTCGYPKKRWDCLDDPPPVPVAGVLSIEVLEVTTTAPFPPLEGVDVFGCSEATIDCPTAPAAFGKTDAQGKLTLPYDDKIEGYLLFRKTGYVTNIARLFRPPPTAEPKAFQSLMIADVDWALVHPRANPALGVVHAGLMDCDKQAAPDISFELDPMPPDAKAFYGVFEAVSGNVTTHSGKGGFFDVPPGKYVVRAHRHAPRLCVRETTLVVQAGGVSDTGLMPARACGGK